MGHPELWLREDADRQHGVHRAGTEAFEIERDVRESQSLEGVGELGRYLGIECTRQLVAGDLDADNVAVMPNAKLAEAHPAQCLFALFDDLQRLRRYGTPVFNARRQTRGRGLVPDAQSRESRELTNVVLSESSVEQRRSDAMLSRSLLAGPEIALVVGINAVSDHVEAALRAEPLHYREQLVLAIEAARGVVLAVLCALHLSSLNNGERDSLLFGERRRVLHLRARQAGRVGENRQHIIAALTIC